jgi:hypothetical protein
MTEFSRNVRLSHSAAHTPYRSKSWSDTAASGALPGAFLVAPLASRPAEVLTLFQAGLDRSQYGAR